MSATFIAASTAVILGVGFLLRSSYRLHRKIMDNPRDYLLPDGMPRSRK
jgi:hypothetical protein